MGGQVPSIGAACTEAALVGTETEEWCVSAEVRVGTAASEDPFDTTGDDDGMEHEEVPSARGR